MHMKLIFVAMVMVLCPLSIVFAQEGNTEKDKKAGTLIMNVIEVKGKIDRPQAVYIINLANPTFKGITLEKTFINEVKDEDFKGLNRFSVDNKLPAEMLNK